MIFGNLKPVLTFIVTGESWAETIADNNSKNWADFLPKIFPSPHSHLQRLIPKLTQQNRASKFISFITQYTLTDTREF